MQPAHGCSPSHFVFFRRHCPHALGTLRRFLRVRSSCIALSKVIAIVLYCRQEIKEREKHVKNAKRGKERRKGRFALDFIDFTTPSSGGVEQDRHGAPIPLLAAAAVAVMVVWIFLVLFFSVSQQPFSFEENYWHFGCHHLVHIRNGHWHRERFLYAAIHFLFVHDLIREYASWSWYLCTAEPVNPFKIPCTTLCNQLFSDTESCAVMGMLYWPVSEAGMHNTSDVLMGRDMYLSWI